MSALLDDLRDLFVRNHLAGARDSTIARLTNLGNLLADDIEMEQAAGYRLGEAQARALARLRETFGLAATGGLAKRYRRGIARYREILSGSVPDTLEAMVERCECLLRAGIPPREFGRHMARLIGEEEFAGGIRGADRRAFARLGGADAMSELGERLLRAGLAPARVRRYLDELKEHLADLIVEEQRAGSAGLEATARAQARLGGLDMLASAMTGRHGARSWSARAPWAAYFAVPTLTLIALIAGVVGATNAAAQHWPGSLRLLDTMRQCTASLLPLFLGWYLSWVAIRQRMRPLWPLIGMIAISMIGGTAEAILSWTDFGSHGPGASGFATSLLLEPAQSGWDNWQSGIEYAPLQLLYMLNLYLICLWGRNWQWPSGHPDRARFSY
jgi:hypothetical protein